MFSMYSCARLGQQPRPCPWVAHPLLWPKCEWWHNLRKIQHLPEASASLLWWGGVGGGVPGWVFEFLVVLYCVGSCASVGMPFHGHSNCLIQTWALCSASWKKEKVQEARHLIEKSYGFINWAVSFFQLPLTQTKAWWERMSHMWGLLKWYSCNPEWLGELFSQSPGILSWRLSKVFVACKPFVKEGETEGARDHDSLTFDVQERLVSFVHLFFADGILWWV